jgi:acetylornithine/succinyldiaminopimelate/putrescine aminotransferase
MAASAEEAVLVAVMDNDIAEATRRLREFLPGELAEFERQAELLLDCIRGTPR